MARVTRQTGKSALAAEIASSDGSRQSGTDRRRLPRGLILAFIAAVALFVPSLVLAQDVSIDFGDDTTLTERAVQLIGLITILSRRGGRPPRQRDEHVGRHCDALRRPSEADGDAAEAVSRLV